MSYHQHFPAVEEALRAGGALHAFRSGGGLRVLRVETPRQGDLTGYGEHPHVGEAFRILADDLLAGGRPYPEVYGKLEEHFLTGARDPDDRLDGWLLGGDTFDAAFLGDKFVFELRALEQVIVPDDVKRAAFKGLTTAWSDARGVKFETGPSYNGGCSTKVVEMPAGMPQHSAWMWHSVRRGEGPSLAKALEAAFVAPVREEAHP